VGQDVVIISTCIRLSLPMMMGCQSPDAYSPTQVLWSVTHWNVSKSGWWKAAVAIGKLAVAFKA